MAVYQHAVYVHADGRLFKLTREGDTKFRCTILKLSACACSLARSIGSDDA